MSAPATAVRGTATLVWVDGSDAAGFLQGLLSNDIEGLAGGSSCRTLFLDASGHIQVDLRAVRNGPDSFTLLTPPESGSALVELLTRYHFSEDVEVIGPEPVTTVTVIGPVVGTTGADLTVPGDVPGTTVLVGDDADAMIAATGATETSADMLERLRIATGVGRFGVDFTSANLVQEAGLQDVAVSFDKGCYLGQETVARVHYRGQVNRRLVHLELDAPAPPGTGVTSGGRAVGTLTSCAVTTDGTPVGLAMVRREAADGAEVDLDGGRHGRIRPVALTIS